MDKLQLISNVRKSVSESELEQALTQLTSFLQTENAYDELYRSAVQAQSQYQRTKRDEATGVISYDNARLSYNQITRQILTIADDLEANRTTTTTTLPPRSTPNMQRTLLLVGAGVLLVAAIGVLFWRNLYTTPQTSDPDVVEVGPACPPFNTGSPFHILLFRYIVFPTGNRAINTHQVVQRKLEQLNDSYNLDVDAQIYDDKEDVNNIPVSLRDAANIGKDCGAELVIIGTEEAADNGTIVTTQYRFLDLGEQFKFTRWRVKENAEVDTVTSVSSIATSGVVTGNIEQNILFLFGIVAYNEQKYQDAVDLLEQVQFVDSTNSLTRHMILQDSYLKLGQLDKQLAALDNALEEHPNYNFALNNRAAISFKNGDNLAAIRDYNVILENNPRDTATLTARGLAHIQVENLEEARKDFRKAAAQKRNDAPVRKQERIIDQKIQEKKREEASTNQQLRVNPKDVDALTHKADVNKSLGDYKEAIKAAEQAIKQDPKGVQGYVALIKIYNAMNLPEKVAEATKRLTKATGKSAIIREAPEIRSLIRVDSILQ